MQLDITDSLVKAFIEQVDTDAATPDDTDTDADDDDKSHLSFSILPMVPRNERQSSLDFNQQATISKTQAASTGAGGIIDLEKESLRQEVEQLRDILRITSLELAHKDEHKKEVEQAQQDRLKQSEEANATLKQELLECQQENEELVHDVMDASHIAEDLKNGMSFQEEALRNLAKRNKEMERQRDEYADEVIANGDLEIMQHIMEELQQRAKKSMAAVVADNEELHKRLKNANRERDEIERRMAVMQQKMSEQRHKMSTSSMTFASSLKPFFVTLHTGSPI
jgi:hypothetical protein